MAFYSEFFKSSGSSGTPSGAIDGSNRTFTVTHIPSYVIADNLVRVEGFGYTYSGGVITMDESIPPVLFIKYFY